MRIVEDSRVETIQFELLEKYPNLYAFTNQKGFIEVAGIFPLLGANGEELDRYTISIILPKEFPRELPIVYEVGGRIPNKAEFHVNTDGSACVFIPDDRWRCFPVDGSLIEFLDGPLYNFFLSQTYYSEHGKWPFGEWSHGKEGLREYYQWLIGANDLLTIGRFLHLLTKNNLKKHYACACGSGKVVKQCCIEKISDLREKVTPEIAKKAMNSLGFDRFKPPYKRARFRENISYFNRANRL